MKHKKFNDIYPYSYLLIRKSDGMKYHGIRCHNVKLKKSPIEDFGFKYFSSEKLKKEFKKEPSNFTFKIRWMFDTWTEACEYEDRVNRKIVGKSSWCNILAIKSCISIKLMNERRKSSMLKKYGVDSNLKIPSVINKIEINNIKKYGCKHHIGSKIIRNKIKDDYIKKYGVEYNWQREDVKAKIKNTNIRKFGVENPMQNKEIQEKTKKSNLIKYGKEHTVQSKLVIDKIHVRREEMYVRLAKMSDEEFNKYLDSNCKHICTRNQKITQRKKGFNILCQR